MSHTRPAHLAVVSLCVAVLVSTAGCLSSQEIRGQETTGLDKKLSTFAFMEEGDLVTLIVDTRATFYREDSNYMPLEICVANSGIKRMSISRESFTLRDAEGNRYPLATAQELIENYQFLDIDRNPTLAELEGLVIDRFAAYTRYDSRFSPTQVVNRGVVVDRLTLPRFGYIVDFIYFPRPKTGIKGQYFELFMDSPELPDPVFVKFEVR